MGKPPKRPPDQAAKLRKIANYNEEPQDQPGEVRLSAKNQASLLRLRNLRELIKKAGLQENHEMIINHDSRFPDHRETKIEKLKQFIAEGSPEHKRDETLMALLKQEIQEKPTPLVRARRYAEKILQKLKRNV